ncbi:MAG TPA: DHH family phosphoesterase, partial [bacterium]|nr:DHH family phosphoesterase [bacterium]
TLIERDIPDKRFDAVILLDNGDFRRTGFVDELKALKSSGVPIVNIDHHTRNDLWKFVNINYANESASSASELVYELMVRLGWEITPSIATSLIAGIYNDTGGFRHPNTTDNVLMIVADLLKKGGNLKKVAKNIENSRPVSLFKLWGIALDRMVIDSRFNLAVSYLTQKDITRCESSEDDIPGLVNLINAVPQVRATLLLYEGSDGKIKGSLRTERDDVDVSVLAQLLGGGGHKRAAGFSFHGRIEKRGNSVVIV